ncbi:MAG: flavoprotein [Micromonosporaceae bacterium]
MSGRVLYVMPCGAGPASDVGRLVAMAQRRGWSVHVIPTAAAVEHFLDVPALETLSGHRVRTGYRRAGESDGLPPADAVIVAPATYNTINKWAAGISDTYPLSLLAELTGLGSTPIAVLPFVNSALANNEVFGESVARLRKAGVTVLYGPGGFEPHPPRTGGTKIAAYPGSSLWTQWKRIGRYDRANTLRRGGGGRG